MLKLKGELERQKQLAEQQENALNEKHRLETEAYEVEQKELNNALIQKYETLLLRKEQEAELKRQVPRSTLDSVGARSSRLL
eukprot:749816-Hanusia_phi.AAC.3